MTLMHTRAALTATFAVMIACGGLATEGSGGGSDASGDVGSDGGGGSSGGGGAAGGAGSGAAAGSAGSGGAAGSSGSAGSGGSSGGGADSATCETNGSGGACVLCADDKWHCPGNYAPPKCPSNLKVGARCKPYGDCLSCTSSGVGVIYNCAGPFRWESTTATYPCVR
jgi:hypothetical protein